LASSRGKVEYRTDRYETSTCRSARRARRRGSADQLPGRARRGRSPPASSKGRYRRASPFRRAWPGGVDPTVLRDELARRRGEPAR
jgi:hypothetical protein